MPLLATDTSDAFNRKEASDQANFYDFWPSTTAGNGQRIKNNIRTGAAQGKASFIQKARCQQCGFPVDINAVDHTGGSFDGNGAGGGISTATYTSTFPNGTVYTEQAGTQSYMLNSGCPLCFSRNSAKDKMDTVQDGWVRQVPLGF